MSKLDSIYARTFTGKYWHNISDYCNRVHHPVSFPYRRYGRGVNRCRYCGAKIGKIKCVRMSYREMIVDSIFESNPLLTLLRRLKTNAKQS